MGGYGGEAVALERHEQGLDRQDRGGALSPVRPVIVAVIATILLTGCGTIATAAVVAGSVAVEAAELAVDCAILVGKGVYKAGEVVVDAVSPEPEKTGE